MRKLNYENTKIKLYMAFWRKIHTKIASNDIYYTSYVNIRHLKDPGTNNTTSLQPTFTVRDRDRSPSKEAPEPEIMKNFRGNKSTLLKRSDES